MTFENTDPLVEVRHIGRGKTGWLLWEDWHAYWEHGGNWYRTMVPSGFLSDKASVPRPLTLLAARDELGLKGIIVHDWIYHNKGKVAVEKWLGCRGMEGGEWRGEIGRPVQFTRRQADALMFRFFREDNIEPRWRRRGAYKLVRLNSRLRGDDW